MNFSFVVVIFVCLFLIIKKLPSSWGFVIRTMAELARDDERGTTREPRCDQVR